MQPQSGYLLHREGRLASVGGTPILAPFRTSWVVLELASPTTARFSLFNAKDDKAPFRTIDVSPEDAVSITTRHKTLFRLLRTQPAPNSFEGVVEHVVDEFEVVSPSTSQAATWANAVVGFLSSDARNYTSFASLPDAPKPPRRMVAPAATSTPRVIRRMLSRLENGSVSSGSGELTGNPTAEHGNSRSSDVSEIEFEFHPSHRQQSSAASSGFVGSDTNVSSNVSALIELVQSQKTEIAKLERLLAISKVSEASLLSASLLGSTDDSGPSEVFHDSEEVSQAETEIFRLQEMFFKCRSQLALFSGQAAASTADKYKWRQAYVQSIIAAMKIVVMEQRSVEKLELGLASIDLHADNIQALLSEADLPSLQKLASDGSYIDDFGFVHKFTSSNPQSADILNFAAGLLMDHFSAQSSYSRENETFWKIHIDMNKPLGESALEAALSHRRYIPERLRPDIWRLLLQNDVQLARSKHRNDYYSLLARSAGFFGDFDSDSNFLDSALTLLTGSGGQGSPPPVDDTAVHATLNDENSAVCNTIRRQILVDIRRTLPNNVYFGREGRGLTNLYRVLVSFARHKPQLGYCQGINFIAAVLLLLLDNEEEVFWALVVLTENDRFFGIRQFDSRLTGARADQKLIVRLLSKYLPDLYRHIERNGTDLSTCFIPWLMCGFYDCVPFRTLLRIWDYFFMAGYSVFYRVAVALMKVQQQSLMELTDPTLILKHIKLFPHLCHDFMHLMKVAFEDLQAKEPWPSWEDLLNQRRKNIKAIEKQDVVASMALRRRRTPTKTPLSALTSSSSTPTPSNSGPTFVTIVEADKCPDASSPADLCRLFVWVDDPVSSSSQLYLVRTEKIEKTGDVLSSTTMPGFPTNEHPFVAKASPVLQLDGHLVLTFTQFRHNSALISTAQSNMLACLDLENGQILWSFASSSANDEDLYATTLLDSKNDILYAITQFGVVLPLSGSKLAKVNVEGNNAVPKELMASAFRLLTASPITCAAVLSFDDAEEKAQSILLIGAGSFIYRIDQDISSDFTPRSAAKVHIPLARTSESDAKLASEETVGELSFVRQIVSAQNLVTADKNMLFWWALCDGSPCLLLYAMHKTNPLHCQILTTLSGTNCSPNCIQLLPSPVNRPINRDRSPNESELSTSDDSHADAGISFTTSNSMATSEGLLVGWPNGSIFQWQINMEKLDGILSNMKSADLDSSSHHQFFFPATNDDLCDCGCILRPSISLLPTIPKSFQVQLTFQKGAPFALTSNSDAGIFTAMRKALVSTFMPSLSKNNPPKPVLSKSSTSVPSGMSGPIRFAPTRQSRRAGNRSSFLYSTRIVNSSNESSNKFEGTNLSSINSSGSTSGGQITIPLSSTFSSNCTPSLSTDKTYLSSAGSSPLRECKLEGCFKLVSISNVFRSDCPVNWMALTQGHDVGKLIWAFQLEWLLSKEGVASSQLASVLPVGDGYLLRALDSSRTNVTINTPRSARSLADHFIPPHYQDDGSWRTICISLKTPTDSK